MPRTKLETIAIHAFVFIFLFSDSVSRAAISCASAVRWIRCWVALLMIEIPIVTNL
jgi:hypothetical protein